MRSSRNGEYVGYEEMAVPKKRHGGVAALVILLIVGAAVAVIGVSKIGGFISDKIVTPVAAWLAPDENIQKNGIQADGDAAPSEGGKQLAVTESFSLEGETLYALQVGVFSSKTNAEVFAGELKARGGAGYVLEDNENWRVLIAGYCDKADAESVKQRLRDEQSMESKLLEISAEKKSFSVTADEESMLAIKSGTEITNSLVARICALSIGVDKGELTAEEAAEEINAMAEELEAAETGLGTVQEEGGAAEQLAAYIKTVREELLSVNTQSITEISGGLKRAYIEAALARKDIAAKADA